MTKQEKKQYNLEKAILYSDLDIIAVSKETAHILLSALMFVPIGHYIGYRFIPVLSTKGKWKRKKVKLEIKYPDHSYQGEIGKIGRTRIIVI